jgi:malic enzyme
MVKTMAARPLIFALANPTPEIMPEVARAAREDAIIATGRSDYPNQVNNVLCFPFIFRGALDVGATAINQDMKIACVNAIAGLARRRVGRRGDCLWRAGDAVRAGIPDPKTLRPPADRGNRASRRQGRDG